MRRLRNWWNRAMRESTRPTSPEGSVTMADYERNQRESERSEAMQMAIEKERQRRGMAF